MCCCAAAHVAASLTSILPPPRSPFLPRIFTAKPSPTEASGGQWSRPIWTFDGIYAGSPSLLFTSRTHHSLSLTPDPLAPYPSPHSSSSAPSPPSLRQEAFNSNMCREILPRRFGKDHKSLNCGGLPMVNSRICCVRQTVNVKWLDKEWSSGRRFVPEFREREAVINVGYRMSQREGMSRIEKKHFNTIVEKWYISFQSPSNSFSALFSMTAALGAG